jgi:aminoglycoside phosphotransferase (APT) family kinase protein
VSAPYVLTSGNVCVWARARGLIPADRPVTARQLNGGVSATVVALHADNFSLVVKQALPELRVDDLWRADPRRTNTEARALRLCESLTPNAVPHVVDHDSENHIVALEYVAGANWQSEVAEGRLHQRFAAAAGKTLATWHGNTTAETSFEAPEAFEELRLRPYHETLIERRPSLATAIAPYLAELRSERRCLVHGDYAMKNMLVSGRRHVVLDFEVAHFGSPVFDVAFFLSLVVLSMLRWSALAKPLGELGRNFLRSYQSIIGTSAPSETSIAGHTACLILARIDGKSRLGFLADQHLSQARAVGRRMLARPEAGIWNAF